MNVVLICLDTYRADCVAAAGRNPVIKTPNLDRLVREGVLFDNAFGEGQPTIQFRRALCTGMRAFPFTGDYDTIGCWPPNAGWHKIAPEQPTLAETLLAGGYATGLCADTYHMFKPTMNFTRGIASWDFIRGQESDNYHTGPLSALDLSKYTKKGVVEPHYIHIQYLLNVAGRQGEMDYLPAKVFTSAIRYVNDNKENRPFFLWVDCFDPHEPFDPPAEYANMYDPDWDEGWEPIHGVHDEADEKLRRRVKALYYGSCTFVDKQIGRLLGALEGAKLLEETLLLVCSDHGLELWDHGALHKNVNKCKYRPNNEILALMRFPGKKHAGKRIKGFIQNQDFFPTLLKLLGVAHQPVDGTDFMPLVEGKTKSVHDHVVTGWSGGGSGIYACVRTLKWNYSCNPYVDEAKRDEMLFDLGADPGETKNVAAKNLKVVADCRRRLEEFLGEKLPATRRVVIHTYDAPVKIWTKNASWAKL